VAVNNPLPREQDFNPMIKCGDCSAEEMDNSNFCSACGRELPKPLMGFTYRWDLKRAEGRETLKRLADQRLVTIVAKTKSEANSWNDKLLMRYFRFVDKDPEGGQCCTHCDGIEWVSQFVQDSGSAAISKEEAVASGQEPPLEVWAVKDWAPNIAGEMKRLKAPHLIQLVFFAGCFALLVWLLLKIR